MYQTSARHYDTEGRDLNAVFSSILLIYGCKDNRGKGDVGCGGDNKEAAATGNR